MFPGIIILFLCLPLVLGSGWGRIPPEGICVLFVVRTALEDRMPIRELAGYAEFARRTRFRLLPGIWCRRGRRAPFENPVPGPMEQP